MNGTGSLSTLRKRLADDSGMALAVVMLMAAVLFILATSVLMLVEYRQTQSDSVTRRNQAMHIADAGINQYLYQLSQQYDYYKTQGALGPVSMDGGHWRVTPSLTPSGTLQLTSVGTLRDGYSRTVTATVTFPGWNSFIVICDGDYSIGAGATFYGNIHSNGNISNSGIITGLATAGGKCTAGTSYAVNYPGGYKNNQKVVDFSQLTKDLNAMKVAAQNAGTYYAASGAKGYRVVVDNKQVTIYKVTAIETHVTSTTIGVPYGTLTQTLVGTAAIPSDGVFYFDDNVWVAGNYGAKITIATSKDLICAENIGQTVQGSNATCGLVASGQILFPYWYQTMPDDQVVQAALLSQTAGVGPSDGGDSTSGGATVKKWTSSYNSTTKVTTWTSSTYNPPLKNSITIKGARAMKTMIGFSSGYDYRYFDKDPVLASNPPPLYPKLPGKTLGISTWTQN